ncbi:SDR family NAD(P)-dependent oxidoreductase [Nonomuraea fuscirosea]|nr:SDR family NAD(P)-dependent oxidoreductase [Nonomuraea fuscirosea]
MVLPDVARSLLTTRTPWEHRAVVIAGGGEPGALASALTALAEGEPAPNLVLGTAHGGTEARAQAVFIFPGQGSQWPGMAAELLETSPVFAARMTEVAAEIDQHVDWHVLEALHDPAALDRLEVVQPVLFAVMVSLAALWESMGVRPSAVVGHSQGEVAAAYVAGGLSLEDAVRVIVLRSRLFAETLVGKGAIAAIALPASDLERRLTAWDGRLSVGARNGPSHSTVVGDEAALAELVAQCEAEGIRARHLASTVASHSDQVDPLHDRLLDLLAPIRPRTGHVPFYSTVTGDVLDTAELTPEYWFGNARRPVAFHDVVTALLRDGRGAFIECSAHPVLVMSVRDTIEVAGADAYATGTLRRDEGGPARFLTSAAEAYANGVPADLTAAVGDASPHRAPLPTYAFQRRRFWLDASAGGEDVTAAGLSAAGHPLLGAAVVLAESGGIVLTGRLALHTQGWLADHAAAGTVLLPGTAFVELAIAAGDHVGCGHLAELTLEAPLPLPERGAVQVQIAVGPETDGARTITVHSRIGEGPWTRHASGLLTPHGAATGLAPTGPDSAALDPAGAGSAGVDLTAWPPPGATPVPVDGLYERLAAAGYGYGPTFQGVKAAWLRDGEVFAEVALPEGAGADRYGLHPALLDAALHAEALLGDDEQGVSLPFAWTGVTLHASGAAAARVRLRRTGRDTVQLVAADPAGAPLITVESLVSRPVSAGGLAPARHDSLYRVEWSALPDLPAPAGRPAAALGTGADALVRQGLAARTYTGLAGLIAADQLPSTVFVTLRDPGTSAHTSAATLPPGSPATLPASATALRPELPAALPPVSATGPSSAPPAGHLVEAAVESPAPSLAAYQEGNVARLGGEVAEEALALVQAWLAEERLAGTRLVIVTRGAVPAGTDGDVPDLAAAPAWGLIRSAQSEHPGRFALLDLDPAGSAVPAGAVLSALADGESQLAVRPALDGTGALLAPRLARAATTPTLVPPAGTAEWRLDAPAKGSLSALSLVPVPTRSLEEGEVRVAVRAAGLNFRDLVVVLGMVPENDEPIGGEIAGVVTEVGPGVTGLTVGDRVLGLMDGAFGPSGVTDQRLLAPVPEGWSFAEAAAVPVAFLTAYYGLVDLADLRPGERVLIHAAAGGVGMAAVQIARHLGAEVYGTAGPAKWPATGLDDDHLASSRTLEFAGRFPKMDVVLNSLAGDFTDASLNLLKPGGRFLELGKTDIRTGTGVDYLLYSLMEAGPDRLGTMLSEVLALFRDGVMERLPVRVWDVRRAPEAFRLMQRAGHVGKIVLRMPPVLDPERPVLVTGGTGTLGGLVARHLISAYGMRHLVLVSRQGEEAAGARELRAELAGLGAEVEIVACDVADRRALAEVMRGRSWSAVVHCAGALDDGVIESLTPERLHKVLASKAVAAWNLHELAGDVDAFILYSSAAGVLGDAGQANYAAANVFLDALAAHRKARGLPAQSLAWGFWEQRSAMSAHLGDADVARMERSGARGLSSGEGLALLDAAMTIDEALLLPIHLDLPRAADAPRLLDGLVRRPARRGAAAGAAPGGAAAALERQLAALPEPERDELLLKLVKAQVAVVLGHSGTDSVSAQRVFTEIGFDSLTAIELRNKLNAATGLRLPSTLVFDYPTPLALAGHLKERLLGAAPAAASSTPATAQTDEPIAIVGMACRLPGGANTPEALWRMLMDEGEGISPFPADRGWDLERLFDADPGKRGTSYVKHAGWLHDAGDFDAEFFGMSPREALATDPQQRLMLEVAWETLERAGIDPAGLKGSDTGVFIGATATGYATGPGRLPEDVEGYLVTGTSISVASGRISYTLGLQGPAVTVDTACSSSLVALHLACEALRRGECSSALAGGVTVLSTPEVFVEFSRQRGLAGDGRIKAFAEAADGTVFSEGAGMVLVEPLSRARKLGHPVLAVVRGSAVNQDGASNGLTAPSGVAQRRVLDRALEAARLTPADVDVVEGHGTGTMLGDPIEVQALLGVYGQGRQVPLWLGSVKSNFGHTQAAAGVAGVIKMVLALEHGVIPATLHVDEPTTHVDWSQGDVRLADHTADWPELGRPRRAGVSSFGISGTNAHVILEQAPAPEPAAQRAASESAFLESAEPLAFPVPVVLSGRGEPGLAAVTEQLRATLSDATLSVASPADVGYSLAVSRAALERRAVILAADRGELVSAPPVAVESVVEGKTGWLFAGQGSQRLGMGRELAEVFPVFRDVFEEVLAGFGDGLVREVIWSDPGRVDQTRFAQAGLFAVEVASARLLESWGMSADVLLGHSIGEVAAAHIAGVLSLQDACSLVAARGRLMQELPAGGVMVQVSAGLEAVRPLLGAGVELAAVNGPAALVLSGREPEVQAAADRLTEQGVRCRRLSVSHAFHSALMEPMLDEFRAVAETLTFHTPRIPVISNLDGEPAGERMADPEYWVAQVRQTVRFADGIAALEQAGVVTCLELGPGRVLSGLGPQISGDKVAYIPTSGRRDDSQARALVAAVGRAYARGTDVDWEAFYAPFYPKRIDLPTYPFQHRRYWLTPEPTDTGDVLGLGQMAGGHALTGALVPVPDRNELLLTGQVSLKTHPWLADHAIMGTALLPGTAFVDLALHAGARAGSPALRELTLHAPLPVTHEGTALHVSVAAPGEDGNRSLAVHSRTGEDVWTRHATGILTAEAARPTPIGSWPPPEASPIDLDGFYDRLAEQGVAYGPTFRGVTRAWATPDGTLYTEVDLPEQDGDGFGIHPALLDAALHAIDLANPSTDAVELPFAWTDVTLHATGATRARVRVTTTDGVTSVLLADSTGAPLAEVGGLTMRPVAGAPMTALPTAPRDGLYQVTWTATPHSAEPSATGAVAAEAGWLREALTAAGVTVTDGLAHDQTILLAAPPPTYQADGAHAGPPHFAPGDDTRSEPPYTDSGDNARPELPYTDPGDETPTAPHAVLGALRDRLADEHAATTRLAVVTSRAVAARPEDPAPDPEQAAVAGLVRAAQAENPGRVLLIDVDGSDASYRALPSVLAGTEPEPAEPELALRDGVALAPRLAKAEPPPLTATAPWRVDVREAGTIDHLIATPIEKSPLGPGEVRVTMRACGLNFRDVLIALGMYPGDAELGSEGAGVVAEVGPGVTGLAVGDRVMGLFDHALGTHAVADRRHLVPIPEGWSFATAASVPAVFATAWYGLVDLADLRPGERVLIHAAAGGVGMAAVQIARHLGAEVYGTAGPAKWPATGLDEDHLASSRTLEFAGRFPKMDVVLNSLAGDFTDASLTLLQPHGRFIEMGKTDLRPDTPGYTPFDLDEAGPARSAEILATLLGLFRTGALTPLPVRAWDLRRAPEAFRHMQQARHIGKVVLTVPAPLDPDGTVLISGGTGGLGALTARHLAGAHGMRRLLLVSRRGEDAPGAAGLRAELTGLGASVEIAAADIGDRKALADLVAGRELTAVVHTAGVVDDGVIGALTPDRLDAVWRPKAEAAAHLHELTREHDLAAFVLFSSCAGTFDGAGQANYAAANAYLDALAAHRTATGAPATSIAWGMWAPETGGMTARLDEADLRRVRRDGLRPMPPEQGLALLDAALGLAAPAVVAAPLDLAAVRDRQDGPPAMLRGLVSGLLGGLLGGGVRKAANDAGEPAESLTERLRALPGAARTRMLLDLVRTHTASVLGHASMEEVDPRRGFTDLGFDSLTAVELRNRLSTLTGARLSATLVFDHPTPEAVAAHIRTELIGEEPPLEAELAELERAMAEAAPAPADRERIAARLRDLAAAWAGTNGDDLSQATADELYSIIDNNS